MRSVADLLRDEERARSRAQSPAERVAEALELGARDLEIFRSAHRPSLSREAAARLLERKKQSGRRRSSCHWELVR